MNAFEQDYEDSVRRAALACQRRQARVLSAGIVWACGGYEGIVSLQGGHPKYGACVLAATGALAAAFYGLVPLGLRVATRARDRETLVTTTERERAGYRDAPPAVLAPSERSPRAWEEPLARLVVAVGVFVSFWQLDGLFGASTRIERAVQYALAIGVGLVSWIGKPAYEAWRKRRNARRERRWERWLASADACEVRPRKWSK